MGIRDEFGGDGGPVQSRRLMAPSQGPIIVSDARSAALYDGLDMADGGDHQRLQLAAIWGAILKHRWTITGIILACLLLGLAVTLLSQRMYTAETTLQIDREASKVLNVEDLAPTEALTGNEFLDTQVGLLKSESLARRVVRKLALNKDQKFLAMAGIDPSKTKLTPAALENALTAKVMDQTNVKQQGLSRLVRVSFTSTDPKLSARVADAFAQEFQTVSLERRFESSSYARTFLEERLRQVKQKLEESERQLVAYSGQQEIINVTPVTETGQAASDSATQSLTATNLAALNSALNAAQAERIRQEQRWRQAQSIAPLSLPEALADPTVQSLRQQRAALAAQYQQQLKIYRPDFPEMQQLQAQIDETDRQLNATTASILSAIRSRYEVAERQESSLASQVSRLKRDFNDLRERNIQNTILQREVDTNRTLYEGLLQRYKEVGVAGGLGANNIAVVDPAVVPDRPSAPRPLLNLAISLLLGVALAAAATVLLELMDESLNTPDDISTKIGLSLLGVIPELEKGRSPIEALADPRSPFSEAYSSARTALQFATADGLAPSMLVTSSRPAEGKSTSALALAQSLAHLGLKVVLVDSDLRNPSVHRLLGVENARGFANYLTGESMAGLVQATSIPGLSVIPSGPLPPNPAELLAGAGMRKFLSESREHFDIVVLDGPPVIGLADAPILASQAATTLLIVESGGARRSVVRMAVRRLAQARGNLIGILLTKFDAKSSSYGYGYGYSYAYTYEYGQRALMGKSPK